MSPSHHIRPPAVATLAALIVLMACGGGDHAPHDGAAGADATPTDGSPSDADPLDTSGLTSDAARTDDGGSGPDAETATPLCTPHRFQHDGVRRGYLLCVPDPLPAGPMPAVLGFHGGGGNAASWQRNLPWHETAAREGFAMVYMQGCRAGLTDCGTADGRFAWNVSKPGTASTVDDQGYTLAVIGRLESEHGLPIDSARLFATGHSLGGVFVYTMRCDHPDLFAAIGPISAAPSDGTCTPAGTTSIYHVHGANDPNLPFETGCCSFAQKSMASPQYLPGCASIPQCFNRANWWPPVRDGAHPFADLVGLTEMATASLGCDASRTPIAERAPCTAYDACLAGTHAEECIIEGAVHGLGTIDAAFDIRAYLWGRFRTH